MKRYYVDKKDCNEFLKEITKTQIKNNVFLNVRIKEYKGKLFSNNTLIIEIG